VFGIGIGTTAVIARISSGRYVRGRCVSGADDWKSADNGSVGGTSSSSLSEPRRVFGVDCAHSGTGYIRSNCCRRRRVYIFPLTVSSSSVLRSFLRRLVEVREIIKVSSSLSYHAAPESATSSPSSVVSPASTACSPESMKNSYMRRSSRNLPCRCRGARGQSARALVSRWSALSRDVSLCPLNRQIRGVRALARLRICRVPRPCSGVSMIPFVCSLLIY
jgi:hypothetical protein